MSSTDFKLEENKIFSTVTGDLVATIEETGLRMQPGKNALTPRVRAFYESIDHAAVMEEKKESADLAAAAAAADPDHEEEEVNTHLLGEGQEERFYFGGVPGKGGTSAPARETPAPQQSSGRSAAAQAVWDIPDSSLPAFSPALGVATQEFKSFVKKHKFSKEQVIELVKRLETKFKKGN